MDKVREALEDYRKAMRVLREAQYEVEKTRVRLTTQIVKEMGPENPFLTPNVARLQNCLNRM